MINKLRQEQIYKEWEAFTAGKEPDRTIISDYILRSWERSKAQDINCSHATQNKVSSAELINRVHERWHMLEVAVPYMKKIRSFINDPDSIIFVTNENGIVLELFGDNRVRELPSAPQLGSKLLEDTIGTNAVGLCIIENRPLEVWGAEHYCRTYQSWSGSADVIRDNDGRIIGSLCLLCRWDIVNTHTLGMVAAVAGAIERQIIIENTVTEKTLAIKQQQAIVELINEGIIVINSQEAITDINSQAGLMLGVSDENVIGKSIYDVILSGVNFLHIMSDGQHIYDREATLKLRSKVFHGTMSTAIIKHDSMVSGLVITIKESQKIHNLVNRVTGSRAYFTFNDIIGASSSIQECKRLGRTAAKSLSTVLLLGESGTGKELFAQSIHNASDRSGSSFVAVNCGAIPRNLVESELFGYEGGAFTGSKKEGHSGKFELSDGGTIFLDEIGDMPLEAQVHLLRVLQTSEVVRVGGKYPKKVNVRVIAATNHDLKKAVDEKSFRDDLYYRLNVLAIPIPPLREHKEDVKNLVESFVRKIATGMMKTITGVDAEAMRALENYNWPGNIRELENIIERAVNICETAQITVGDLPDYIGGPKALLKVHNEPNSLRSKESEAILSALSEHNGNLRVAAKALGIARSTLYEKLKKMNIPHTGFRKKI